MRRVVFVAVMIMAVSLPYVASATTVGYSSTDLGGGRWEYLYQVTNDALGVSIDEFTVFFDYGLYTNLAVDYPKPDWDALTLNPDFVLGAPVPGYYDALALVTGIAPGATEGGFRVSFDWLGTATPGFQSFDIVDAATFDVLDSGITSAATAVLEPVSAALLFVSLIGLGFTSRTMRTIRPY